MATKISIEQAFGTGLETSAEEVPTIRFGDRTSKKATPEVSDLGIQTPSGEAFQGDPIEALNGIAKKHNTVITSGKRAPISYGAGAGSAHGRGTAGDFRTSHLTKEQGDALIQELRTAGWWVNDERYNWKDVNPKTGRQRGTGPHIHAEWRGKGPAPSDAPVAEKPKGKISIAEAFGAESIAVPSKTAPAKKGPTKIDLITPIKEGLSNSADAVVDTGTRLFNSIMDRVKNGTEQVARTEAEIDYMTNQYMEGLRKRNEELPSFLKKTEEQLQEAERTYRGLRDVRYTRPMASAGEVKKLESQEKKEAQREALRISQANARSKGKGFWGTMAEFIDNPVHLIANTSLPANAIKMVGREAIRERQRYDELKQAVREQEIVENPHHYPSEVVNMAKANVAARDKKRQDAGPGVVQQWNDLRRAAKEHPEKFAADLINAMMADPEMLIAPVGIGAKPIQAVQAARGATVTSRAMNIADKLVDAGTAGAATNLAIESTAAQAQGRELTKGEARSAAGIGFAMSGALGGIFAKGADARAKLSTVTPDTFENVLRDIAKEELAIEQVIERPDTIDLTVRNQIEESLGITNMSNKQRAAWRKKRHAELRKTLEEESLDADYYQFKAEERVARREEILAETEGRAAAQAAEAAKVASVEAAYEQSARQRSEQFAQDWDNAVAARDQALRDSDHAAAIEENRLRETAAKLDQEEIMAAAFDEDVPAIKNAMLRAAQRDAKLRVPKWQRGEIDQRLLNRLGVGSLFAGTAYAVTENEDAKMHNAFLAGLAAFMLPGGGSVARRMRQAGAVSDDGLLLDTGSWVFRQGKVLVGKDASDALARDIDIITRAKNGDQQAFSQLYNDYAPKLIRQAERKLKGISSRIGMNGEDVVIDAFSDVFSNLDKYDGSVPFSAYMNGVVRNKVVSAVRLANRDKAGKGYSFSSIHTAAGDFGDSARAGHITEGESGAIRTRVEEAAKDIDTPENIAIQDDVVKNLPTFLKSLPEQQRAAFILNKAEEMTVPEIAALQNRPEASVYSDVKRAQDKFLEWAAKGYGAVRERVKVENTTPVFDPNAPVKRGRGRPRKIPQNQAGNVDPRLLQVLGVGTVGALVGQWLVDNKDKEGNVRDDPNAPSKIVGAIAGAGMGILLFGGAKGRQSISRGAEYLYGASSTAILNRSKAVHKRVLTVERRILSHTHEYLENVGPFLVRFSKLPKEGSDILARALMTGRSDVINKILAAFGDQELIASYGKVRSTLDSLGDQLINLKRFSRGNIEYFPRVVTDKEGLFKAIGKVEADGIQGVLDQANMESVRKNGRPLSELEESALINQLLFVDKRSVQPGFTKNRGIEEITPELQQYYATPAESLHSYIRAAVQDIEAAKFFGDYSVNMKRGNNQYLDVDSSVKNLIAEEIKNGSLSQEDARVIADILRARFKEGLRAENDTIRNIKNIGNIGLLGSFWSAAMQLGDVPIQVYTQGLRPTLEAIVRQVTKKKIVDMKDFGLADHIAEEFAGQLRTSRWVNNVFKATLFAAVDSLGKNTALNAAIIKARGLVKSDSGVLQLANKYKEAFGDDFDQLVSELRGGKISDLTQDYAFMELSRTQPISRIEMPKAYLKHPNMRSYLWLKSFTMKQLDLVRREAFNEIKTGTPRGIARGLKNLTQLSIMLGIAGATSDIVKDYLHNGVAALTGGEMKDVEVTRGDLVMNIFKAFGFSQYTMDRVVGVSRQEASERRAAGDEFARPMKATPVNALADGFVKPAFVSTMDQLFTGDQQKAKRLLVPFLGPYLAEQVRRAKKVEDGDDPDE